MEGFPIWHIKHGTSRHKRRGSVWEHQFQTSYTRYTHHMDSTICSEGRWEVAVKIAIKLSNSTVSDYFKVNVHFSCCLLGVTSVTWPSPLALTPPGEQHALKKTNSYRLIGWHEGSASIEWPHAGDNFQQAVNLVFEHNARRVMAHTRACSYQQLCHVALIKRDAGTGGVISGPNCFL